MKVKHRDPENALRIRTRMRDWLDTLERELDSEVTAYADCFIGRELKMLQDMCDKARKLKGIMEQVDNGEGQYS